MTPLRRFHVRPRRIDLFRDLDEAGPFDEESDAEKHFAEGLDEFWKTEVAPRLLRLVERDGLLSRYLRQHYRLLCTRPGFRALRDDHPRDAVQWYFDSLPAPIWTAS